MEHANTLTGTSINTEYLDTPLTRCSYAAVPLLIEAYERLHCMAAPKATRIAEHIGNLLNELIEVAGDVEAYGNSWTGGGMGALADNIREATREYNGIMIHL